MPAAGGQPDGLGVRGGAGKGIIGSLDRHPFIVYGNSSDRAHKQDIGRAFHGTSI
jgi:hypothetical protein